MLPSGIWFHRKQTMIDRLLDLLTGRPPSEKESEDALRVSAAALLIEAAPMDGTFDTAERAMIDCLLAEKFQLEPHAVHSLMEEAQRRLEYSAQYFPFTHEICTR